MLNGSPQCGLDCGLGYCCIEAGSDPRGHLWVTWGVYLCAGKPPLADIILSHPPDLTRCDSVIGLAIPAMSGHIQYRVAAATRSREAQDTAHATQHTERGHR